jgi:hypothetical protein
MHKAVLTEAMIALPVRKPNAAYRSREHLTEREIERLIEAVTPQCHLGRPYSDFNVREGAALGVGLLALC